MISSTVQKSPLRSGCLKLIQNAGGSAVRGGAALMLSDSYWQAAFHMKLFAAVRLDQAFLPRREIVQRTGITAARQHIVAWLAASHSAGRSGRTKLRFGFAFLASDRACPITGSECVIAGGSVPTV